MKEGRITIAELGPRLKLIRQQMGISQKELAQALDMNPAILSKFENGGMVYASILLDVLCFFRGKININFLLQPGDDYNINDERTQFTNNKQRDVIIAGKRDLALLKMNEILEKTKQEWSDAIRDFANFTMSE